MQSFTSFMVRHSTILSLHFFRHVKSKDMSYIPRWQLVGKDLTEKKENDSMIVEHILYTYRLQF